MDSGLQGKTAIVTGASGGIGREIVRQYIGEGANVVMHYFRGQERAEAIAAEFPAEQILLAKADLRNEAEVAAMFGAAQERFGGLHVLAANAGVWPTAHETIREMSLKRWDETVLVDMTSVFLCIREFLNRAENSQLSDPAIVMIGSTAGHFGEAGHGDYAASKSGLMHGLLMSLKNEIVDVAPRGRVNIVCPGWTLTEMARDLTNNQDAMIRALQTIPLKKFGKPEDVASAVVFLSSNRLAGHVTGESLFVSGGMEGRVLHAPEDVSLDGIL